MKKVLTLIVTCLFAAAGFFLARAHRPGIESVLARLRPAAVPKIAVPEGLAIKPGLESLERTWTFRDGTRLDASLIAADSRSAQLLVPQGVGQIELAQFSDTDRQAIQSWIAAAGKNGVAGLPINLKTHAWPQQWRDQARIRLTRVGDTPVWRSKHFEITDQARLKPEALESIAMICESVDGAMSALPCPCRSTGAVNRANRARSSSSRSQTTPESTGPATGMGAPASSTSTPNPSSNPISNLSSSSSTSRRRCRSTTSSSMRSPTNRWPPCFT